MGNETGNSKHTQQKQHPKKGDGFLVQGSGLTYLYVQLGLFIAKKYSRQQQHCRPHGVGASEPKEGRDVHPRQGKEVQVLGVADWSKHTSQVGRDGHQCDGIAYFFLLIGHLQHHNTKGDESNKSYVVGDEHTAEKAQKHQRTHQPPHGSHPAQHPPGHILEEILPPQPLYNKHEAEENDEGVEVDVGKVLPTGGRNEAGGHRQHQRHSEHHVPAEGSQNVFDHNDPSLPLKQAERALSQTPFPLCRFPRPCLKA